MSTKPWSQDFNPRLPGEHVTDWLQREVALIERLGAQGKPVRCITITQRDARAMLALVSAAHAEGGAA